MFKKKDSNINLVSLTGQNLGNADLYMQSAPQEGIDPSEMIADINRNIEQLRRLSEGELHFDVSAVS